MSFRFTVEEDSSDEGAIRALTELRRMARLGRQAERALREIREKGYFDRRAPLASKPQISHVYDHGRMAYTVRIRALPMRLGVSREDLPPMSGLSISLGELEESGYSAHDCLESRVYVVGDLLTQEGDGVPEYVASEIRRRDVGYLRFNKGGLSYLEPNYAKKAWRVYKDWSRSEAAQTLEAFAKNVADRLIVLRATETGEVRPAAKTLDLRKAAAGWLVEDGHAARLLTDIRNAAAVAQVMGA